jgi:hypothetical protein
MRRETSRSVSTWVLPEDGNMRARTNVTAVASRNDMSTSVAFVYAAFHRHMRVAGFRAAEAYQSRLLIRRKKRLIT